MSSPRAPGNDGDKNRDAAVAKTAGFVVFSGIAMSILKAINPLNKNKCEATPQPLREPPPPEPILKLEASTSTDQIDSQSTSIKTRTIDIVKGDTLWGLSRKYGVSIDAIKEANGLSGDTIYAGKKLVIP